MGTPSFEIIEIPASGAFGTVCVARDNTGTVVALKVLKAEHNDEKVLQRARDEARMLHKLEHPNIVRVHDLLEYEGRPVVVMEYVDGVTLHRLLRAFRQGIPAPAAIEIIRQIALALDAAFSELRIVHRDIKPANVLFSRTGEVKVVDFGTARAEFEEREAQTVNMVMGSVGYVSPERYLGVQDQPACDIYALGVMLFVLLTGKQLMLPRNNPTHDEALRRQVKFAHPDIGEQAVASLHNVLEDMVQHSWKRRPSAASVANRLGMVLAEAQIRADLATFAGEAVPPLLEGRIIEEPIDHEDYADVAFLDQNRPLNTSEALFPGLSRRIPDRTPAPRGRVQAPITDPELVAFLAQPGWETRVVELKRLLDASGEWTVGPFLDILERAAQPWWTFWSPSASPSQVIAALNLVQPRADGRVKALAKRLSKHRHADIARVARRLL